MCARIFRCADTQPHRNLAREEALLLACGAQSGAALFLWQNAAAVIIGRHQNAWRECRCGLLAREGVVLARRTTGGGAVFHDLGNLNFSFILPRAEYDLDRQLGVVCAAVRSFGIACEFSGRNDLLAQGRKFSGNAFRFTREGALHHGTLLVCADAERMGRYLRPSPEKLAARGVASVPSRVVNLSELSAAVTVEALAQAMEDAFRAEYGPAVREDAENAPWPGYAALAARNASWAWNYGATPAFDVAFAHRFPWGGVELQLSRAEGRAADCTVYTDAMDTELAPRLRAALTGCRLEAAALAEAARLVQAEVADWLAALEI